MPPFIWSFILCFGERLPRPLRNTWRKGEIYYQHAQKIKFSTKESKIHNLSPFLGFHEDGGHLSIRVQDLIDLHLFFVINAIWILCIAKTAYVIHSWEVIVALPLGTKTNLVTMMLNFWLVPQCYLDLRIKLQLWVLARLANYKNHSSITNEISTICELHLPNGGFHFVPITSSLRKNIFKLSDQR